MPMQLVGAHVEITAPDLDEEIAFYREHFGGRVVARDGDEWALVRCGPYDIAVRCGEPIESPTFHLGFRMPSREACRGAFEAFHAAAVVKPYEDHDGWGDFVAEDPAGYHVQVYWD